MVAVSRRLLDLHVQCVFKMWHAECWIATLLWHGTTRCPVGSRRHKDYSYNSTKDWAVMLLTLYILSVWTSTVTPHAAECRAEPSDCAGSREESEDQACRWDFQRNSYCTITLCHKMARFESLGVWKLHEVWVANLLVSFSWFSF